MLSAFYAIAAAYFFYQSKPLIKFVIDGIDEINIAESDEPEKPEEIESD